MFPSFAGFWGAEESILAFEPAEKKTVKGSEDEERGRRAGKGTVPSMEGRWLFFFFVALKGKREGVRRSLGKTEGGERDVCLREEERGGGGEGRTEERAEKEQSIEL